MRKTEMAIRTEINRLHRLELRFRGQPGGLVPMTEIQGGIKALRWVADHQVKSLSHFYRFDLEEMR